MKLRAFGSIRLITAVMALGILIAVVSCAKKEEATATNNEPATTTTTPTVSDANIAAIVVAANTADVDNGKMAEGKTKNNEVKAFATQMVTDHSASNKAATDLASKLNLTPEDNETSQSLKSTADSTRDEIKKLDGASFDKAYVDNEVALHKQVLDALDQLLIPSAQNADLKALLEKTRPVIQEHYEHAQHLQATLNH